MGAPYTASEACQKARGNTLDAMSREMQGAPANSNGRGHFDQAVSFAEPRTKQAAGDSYTQAH